MNILHMKYAVEVAKQGSINKASEALLVAQPNLSRSIKELEADIGITIFERSAKGMVLTGEGEEFIGYAKKILSQIDEVETMYHKRLSKKQEFSISVPRVTYIAEAFMNFCDNIGDAPIEFYYRETNAMRAIKNLTSADYKLGIIRYSNSYDKYFRAMLEEKGLASRQIAQFTPILVTKADSPLALKDEVYVSDLRHYVEIAQADPFVPSIPTSEVIKEEMIGEVSRRVFLFERATQLSLLSRRPDTFMWSSPITEDLMQRYGLIQRRCIDNKKTYTDLLIWRQDYQLSELDNLFWEELMRAKQDILG